MYVRTCLHVCLSTTCEYGGHGGQKRTSDSPELELHMVVSALVVLRIEHGSSTRAAGSINPQAKCLASDSCYGRWHCLLIQSGKAQQWRGHIPHSRGTGLTHCDEVAVGLQHHVPV